MNRAVLWGLKEQVLQEFSNKIYRLSIRNFSLLLEKHSPESSRFMKCLIQKASSPDGSNVPVSLLIGLRASGSTPGLLEKKVNNEEKWAKKSKTTRKFFCYTKTVKKTQKLFPNFSTESKFFFRSIQKTGKNRRKKGRKSCKPGLRFTRTYHFCLSQLLLLIKNLLT